MKYIIKDVNIFDMAYREVIREKKRPTGTLVIKRAEQILTWINNHNRKVIEYSKS